MDRATLLRTAVSAVSAGTLLAACGGGEPSARTSPAGSAAPSVASASPPPTGPPTVGLEELAPLTLSLEGGPDWPAALNGSVWILAPDGPLTGAGEPFVYRLDAQTGEEQARVEVAGRLCQGMAAGFGALWVCTDTGLARIDPATNDVVAEIEFQTAQVFLRPVMSADRVWMLAGNVTGDQVVEIDPAINQVVATHPLGRAAASLAFGDGAIWATATGDGALLRLDPATGEVTVHAEDLPAATSISFADGNLWIGLYGVHGGEVAAPGEPTIARISAEDGSDRTLVDIGTTTMVEGDIWASDDAVWLRSPADPFLVSIDPDSGSVIYAVAGFYSGGTLTVVDGAIWTTSTEFQTAWRIEP